jgi:hypothetical protein
LSEPLPPGPRTAGAATAGGASAAALALLCLGLLPVWALAIQTPFRLIDDYGAVFAVQRLGVTGFLRDSFSLAVNPVRFRPTHDLGQLLCYWLFSTNAALHHVMRLLMKLAAFAALWAVALRAIEGASGHRLATGERRPLMALAVALFFYFPNNPEARLAPQELATILYFVGALFFMGWTRRGLGRSLADFLGFVCFTLALWSKEPNFITATPLLAVAAADHTARGGALWKRTSWLLAYLAVWVHAALKAAVMNAAGYGRSPLSWAPVMAMLRELPQRILLSAAAAWIPILFLTGVMLFAWFHLRRAPEGRLRAGLPFWMLLASLAALLLMWAPVLRYAAPAVAFLVLVTVIGFGSLLSFSPTPRGRGLGSIALSALAVLMAATNYRDMVAQFSVQYVAGHTEEAVLSMVERIMSQEPARSIHVAPVSEYEYRLGVYFNEHRLFFAGRSTPVRVLRAPDGVPAGGYLVGRQVPEGFAQVLRMDVAPSPSILGTAESVARAARMGAPLPAVVLDAGAEPPSSWFVSARSVEAAAIDAGWFGARPGGDAAANTQAIQAALDAAGSAGGGIVAINRPGVYDLAAQGPNPYYLGHQHCLELRFDNLSLRIGPAVTLRLADGQQSDATGPVDIVIWSGRRNLKIGGGGTILGNTAGQRGWSRGYSQITNGVIVFSHGQAGARSETIRIEDLVLADHFSNAINLSGWVDNRDRDIRIVNVRARDTGEGPQVMNADDVTLRDDSFENATVPAHPGDGFELWNVSGFLLENTTVRGRLGGSAIDLYGARNGTVDGFVIDGHEGIAVQENTALHTYSERVRVTNGVTRLAAGTGLFTKGVRVRDVTIAGVEVHGAGARTIGFHISRDNPDQPLVARRQEGPVTLERCRAHGLDIGLLIETVASLTVTGGDYSDNISTPQSDGIRWIGQGNAASREDTKNLVIRGVKATANRRHGIHLDGQGLTGREPAGSITGCVVGGNGEAGVYVTSGAGHDLARDVRVDDSCLPVAGLTALAPNVRPAELEEGRPELSVGFWLPETWADGRTGRWTKQDAVLRLGRRGGEDRLIVDFSLESPRGETTGSLEVNGRRLASFRGPNARRFETLDIGAIRGHEIALRIRVDTPFVPRLLDPRFRDDRTLGLFLHEARLERATAPGR